MLDDFDWLDEENAHLGPFVRAGLGILMRSEDWTWWYHPAEISGYLSRLMKSGIAAWGTDSRLLSASQWLDAEKALQIAEAFKRAVTEQPKLRIKISREVWSWGDVDVLTSIRQDLSKAIAGNRIFFDWPFLRRPHRQGADPARPAGIIVGGSPEMKNAGTALARRLPQARWVDDVAWADVYIGSLQDYRESSIEADIAIILEQSHSRALEILDRLRSRGTRCAVRFSGPDYGLIEWLEEFGDRWRFEPVDEALRASELHRPAVAEVLASNHSFIRHTVRLFRDERKANSIARRSYIGGGGGLYIAEELALRSPVLDVEARAMPAPTARVLSAGVSKDGNPITRFPTEGAVRIAIGIVYRSFATKNQVEFPEHMVSWQRDSKTLNVHMLELGKTPHTAQIELPKQGISSFAEFEYHVELRQSIDLRFIVSDGVRIVQTARLKGGAGEDIAFSIESANDPLQQEKKEFNLALLVNDSLGKQSSATVLTAEGITLQVLQSNEMAQARDTLLETISRAVTRTKGDHVATYFELASLGKTLFDGIKSLTPGWPEKLDRIQLTTQADVYFPLEYLFDGEMPDDESAGLCPERTSCLKSGIAVWPCAIRQTGQHLCPMNFIGVSAFIERQTWTPAMPAYPWLKLPSSLEDRKKIGDLKNVVFGASDIADEFPDSDIAPGVAPVRVKQIAQAFGGPVISTWPDWVAAIKSAPSLLVLIPHIQDGKLFIGDQKGLYFGSIKTLHIGDGKPVVIAMGCTSALGPLAFTGLPAILKNKGAISVIGALTEILGRYANVVTLKLAQELQSAAAAATPTSIGEIVSRTRRQLLSYDLAIGLVVIAFGDADYTLGG